MPSNRTQFIAPSCAACSTPIVILRRLDVRMLSQRFVSEYRVKSKYLNSMLFHALLVVAYLLCMVYRSRRCWLIVASVWVCNINQFLPVHRGDPSIRWFPTPRLQRPEFRVCKAHRQAAEDWHDWAMVKLGRAQTYLANGAFNSVLTLCALEKCQEHFILKQEKPEWLAPYMDTGV